MLICVYKKKIIEIAGNFKVYSSPKTRCIQSAESYVEGLLSGLELNNQSKSIIKFSEK